MSVSILKRYGLLLAGVAAVAGLVLNSYSNKNQIAGATPQKALDANSSVAEILEVAENSIYRWQTIRVEGRSGVDGDLAPFKTWVKKPNSYRSEEGGNTIAKKGQTQLVLWPAQKKAKEFTMPQVPESVKARLDANREIQNAEDPTLAKEGELVVDTPINDFINPSYFVRRELRYGSKAVTKVGLTNIAGRKAIQLKVTFPKELAKEDYWDVFVDTETGILLGLVVNPLPGNPKFETYIDSVEINPTVDNKVFDVDIPFGYVVEKGM